VAALIRSRSDGTKPEQGWPWPWDDSHTTDCAYAFDGGRVWTCIDGSWFPAADGWPDGDAIRSASRDAVFLDMSERKRPTLGPRSGVVVFGEFDAE